VTAIVRAGCSRFNVSRLCMSSRGIYGSRAYGSPGRLFSKFVESPTVPAHGSCWQDQDPEPVRNAQVLLNCAASSTCRSASNRPQRSVAASGAVCVGSNPTGGAPKLRANTVARPAGMVNLVGCHPLPGCDTKRLDLTSSTPHTPPDTSRGPRCHAIGWTSACMHVASGA
jgi:hypothetical protein